MSRAAIILLLALGCGSDPVPFSPRFQPAGGDTATPIADLPWPSDLHRGTDGNYRVTPETLPLGPSADERVVRGVAASLAERGCVGVTTGVVFPLDSGDQDDPLVVDDAAIHFVDLETASELTTEHHLRQLEQQLFVRPRRGQVLAPGHRYAVYLDATMTSSSGELLTAQRGFRRALDRHDAFADLRSYLADTGVAHADLAGATTFTTCDERAGLRAAAADLDTTELSADVDRAIASGPELDALLGTPDDNRFPGLDNPGGIAHADIGYVVLGSFDAPNYQAAAPGELGRWQLDADGNPTVQGSDPVPYLLALPRSDDYSNLPVIVFQHGLSNSRTQVLEVANMLTANGFAVIGIDIPFHGDRFPEAADRANNFTDELTADGLADPTGPTASMYLFNIRGGDDWLDPRIIRASFAQSIIDMIALGTLITDGSWDSLREATGHAELSFDPDAVVFAGESFGGIIGASAMAYQPRYGAGFLAAAGGGLLADLLEPSPTYGGLFLPILGGALDVAPGEIDPAFDPAHTHLSFQLIGPLLDIGDPVAHVGELTASGVHLALVSAFADESVPNQASQLLAATAGLDWVDLGASTDGPRFAELDRLSGPVSGNRDGVTAAFVEVTPATHGMITRRWGERKFQAELTPALPLAEPIEVENPIRELQRMLTEFALGHAQGLAPTVIDPFAE